MQKWLTSAVVSASLTALTACAAQPKVEVNFTGLGSSEISRVIIKNFGNSVTDVGTKIKALVNSDNINNSPDRKAALENIGLDCRDAPICIYHGTATSKLTNSDGSTSPQNNVTDTYDIAADISAPKIKYTISITRKPII